ncbi:MAG TPA: hypothetical protein PKA64_13670, partial [Myxococcota bacterium]|nr:hypothetical protein [Myxococcota bacterium]
MITSRSGEVRAPDLATCPPKARRADRGEIKGSMHDGGCRVPIEALPVTPERRAEARRRADRGRAAVEQALPSRVSARRIRSVADVAPFGAAREVRVATAPGRR